MNALDVLIPAAPAAVALVAGAVAVRDEREHRRYAAERQRAIEERALRRRGFAAWDADEDLPWTPDAAARPHHGLCRTHHPGLP